MRTNRVAVLVRDGALAAAQEWVRSAGLPADKFLPQRVAWARIKGVARATHPGSPWR